MPPVHGLCMPEQLMNFVRACFHIFGGDTFLTNHAADKGAQMLGMGIELPQAVVQPVRNAARAVFLRTGGTDRAVFQRLMNGGLGSLHGNVQVMGYIGQKRVAGNVHLTLLMAPLGNLPFAAFDGNENISHQKQDQQNHHHLDGAVHSDIVMGDIYRAVGCLLQLFFHNLPEPDAGGKEIEEQNHNAHGGAVPEAAALVGLKGVPVIGKAHKAPDGQHQVGFGFHGAAEQQSRQERAEEENNGNGYAKKSQFLS